MSSGRVVSAIRYSHLVLINQNIKRDYGLAWDTYPSSFRKDA